MDPRVAFDIGTKDSSPTTFDILACTALAVMRKETALSRITSMAASRGEVCTDEVFVRFEDNFERHIKINFIYLTLVNVCYAIALDDIDYRYSQVVKCFFVK